MMKSTVSNKPNVNQRMFSDLPKSKMLVMSLETHLLNGRVVRPQKLDQAMLSMSMNNKPSLTRNI
jgi:hypothetical protein